MDKWTVARTLDEIARYLELSDANKFKARAFEKASRAIESTDRDLADLVAKKQLTDLSGIGKATSQVVEEIFRTGSSSYLEELRTQYPPGVFEMLRVPSLGLKKIGMLFSELGIASLDELEEAANDGRLAKLKGFGPGTVAKILEGIEWARKRESNFLLPIGIEVGEGMRERLAGIDAVEDAEVAGSVRRRLEVIRNVNLVIATTKPEKVLKAIEKLVSNFETIDETTAKGLARNEVDVLFHLTTPEDFGTTVLRATGTTAFVEAFEKKIAKEGYELRGNALYRNGRHVNARTEHDLFEKTGIAFVEPERRESGDDLARKTRTKLVHVTDLRGTFHVHTTYSDGRNTIKEMLDAAKARGFEYVGLSDHSKAAYYAGGLTEDDLRRQHAEIDEHRAEVAPMRVFRGTEADILPDGSIDYGAKTLGLFDFVIASVHSQFKMPTDEMTERILRALDDPHVTFLGHLTGRRLLNREGYSMDFERVFERAGERGVMIEINGNPQRLDLDWRRVKSAMDRGVRFSIHPDAHSINEYNAVISGTWVARKAGLSAKEIFNTKPVEEIEAHFAARKKGAPASSRPVRRHPAGE